MRKEKERELQLQGRKRKMILKSKQKKIKLEMKREANKLIILSHNVIFFSHQVQWWELKKQKHNKPINEKDRFFFFP